MRATCINLQRSPDRWTYMQAQADILGMQLDRLDAVDGINGLPQRLHPQFLHQDGGINSTLTSGEVGCYASHLLACERLLSSSEPFLIVLEDDAELERDFIATACAAVIAAPLGWDLIHLSTKFKRSPYPIAALPHNRSLVRYSRLPVNTAAYILSRSGAAKFLQPQVRVRPVDQEIRHAWFMGLDVLGVYPAPARQDPRFDTTIEGVTNRQWADVMSKVKGHMLTNRALGLSGRAYCAINSVGWWLHRHLTAYQRTPRSPPVHQTGTHWRSK